MAVDVSRCQRLPLRVCGSMSRWRCGATCGETLPMLQVSLRVQAESCEPSNSELSRQHTQRMQPLPQVRATTRGCGAAESQLYVPESSVSLPLTSLLASPLLPASSPSLPSPPHAELLEPAASPLTIVVAASSSRLRRLPALRALVPPLPLLAAAPPTGEPAAPRRSRIFLRSILRETA